MSPAEHCAEAPREADSSLICGTWDWEYGGVKRPADADFIAHARQDLPDALAEIDRLRAEIERLRGDVRSLAAALQPFAELSCSFADAYGLARQCQEARLALLRADGGGGR